MGEEYIDLHTHSLASDGTDTPAQLAVKARDAGVAAFAITDHDTVAGVEEAMKTAGEMGIECIPGCEIAVQEDHLDEVHILGLWVDWRHPELVDFLEIQTKNRLRRNQQIIVKLQAQGIDITFDEVLALSRGGSCGRPHIARTLVAKGYAADVRTAFARYLGGRGSAFVPRVLSSPEKGIKALTASGAIVVLAHPCTSRRMSAKRLDGILKKYIAHGLTALEVFHSVHTPFQQRLCLKMAARHGLLISGGSDYHGPVKPYARLGYSHYGQRVPYRFLEKMKEWRRARGLPLEFTLEGAAVSR